MAQQWLAGVPMEVLAASDDDVLTGWWARFVRGGLRGLPAMRLSEVSLSVGLGKGRLMAKPDLLAISPGERVVIVDYKTSRKVSAKALRERLQTRVYMYVVTRAVEGLFGQPVRPEQVEMRYWFVNEERPSVTLAYSQDVYAADEVYLADLIARAVATESFDKTDDVSKCRRCGYRRVCERGLQVMGAETEGI
jgi:CRISPR/Cas system-associated exonuclease Cas4 (RecB family)